MSRFRWISCVPATFWHAEATVAHGSGSALGEAADGAWSGMEADLILDGTIQRGLGRVRIIMRLVDMRVGGEIVWAGRFDREMTNPLAMQDELGAAIVAQVDPELMQHEGQTNRDDPLARPDGARSAASSAARDVPAGTGQLH